MAVPRRAPGRTSILALVRMTALDEHAGSLGCCSACSAYRAQLIDKRFGDALWIDAAPEAIRQSGSRMQGSRMHGDGMRGGYEQWEFFLISVFPFVSTGIRQRERGAYVEENGYVSRSMKG